MRTPANSRPASPARRAWTALPLVALAAATMLFSACGSSHVDGTEADPATLVPVSAPLYIGAELRPQGDTKTAALEDGKALTGQPDPYARLLGALQSPGSTAPKLSDVLPWLGPHAGAFVTSLKSAGMAATLLQEGLLGRGTASVGFPFSGSGGAQGAIVLDTSDVAKARSFLEARAKSAGASAVSYHGTSYMRAASGVSFAIVKKALVLGTQAGVEGVIDTAAGTVPPLARAAGYKKLLAQAPAQALGHLYVNPAAGGAAGTSAGTAGGAGSSAGTGLLGLLTGGAEANVSLVASAGALSLDADTLTSSSGGRGLFSADPEGAKALEALPEGSWLALGLGDAGKTLSADVAGIESLLSVLSSGASGTSAPSTGLNITSLAGAMLAPLKIMAAPTARARQDYASWMGPGAVFGSGGSLLELQAAIVIASNEPQRSRAAVAKLAAALRARGGSIRKVTIPGTEAAIGVALNGLPVILDLAAGQDASGQPEFVLGFGEASVESALAPKGTLAGASSTAAARSALGETIKPTLLLEFPTLLSLLEGIGLTEDPTIAPFVPYLHAAGTLAGGGSDLGGGVQRFRLSLGLQSNE